MWAGVVASVRAHRGDAEPQSGIDRLSGGFNNGVYSVGGACVKLYRVDDRRRWEREWRALAFLAEHRPGLAPRPIWYDPGGDPPAVVMERLPGVPMHDRPIGAAELDALGGALAALHAAPGAERYPATVVGTPETFVAQVRVTADRLGAMADDPLARRSAERLRAWLGSGDAAVLAAAAPAVFSRGDAFLANCLWDGRCVRFVDFEYAGRSDAAFDLADLVEGTHARSVTDERWAAFVDRFGLGPAALSRFRAARRLAAHFWLTVWWRPGMARPEDRIEQQLGRMSDVLRSTR